ncbi:MAG TPA: T9SS type A sorting domain-containing protein, partial [Phaeodactylibacter sp.]|nr:T9SS type A sorting domain-containing protein [Phaeodactylibacter sp.]
HSTDGQSYQVLGKVRGAGISVESQYYSFVHDAVPLGKNYYRLRQVDFDGAVTHSFQVVVEVKGDNPVSIRPTSVDDVLQISFEAPIRKDVLVQVFDVAGRKVLSHSMAADTDSYGLRVQHLQAGLYFLQVDANGQVHTLKFVKNK